jgi:hypothetical protein
MFITTLLSCRLLERIAIAKLQAIAFFISRSAGLFGSSNPKPYSRKWRCVIEDNVSSLLLDTHLFPEKRKIYSDRSLAPLVIDILKHRGTGRVIAGSQYACHGPIFVDSSTCCNNRPQCILQSISIVRLSADLNIGYQAKQGPTPVRAPPRMRAIQAAV